MARKDTMRRPTSADGVGLRPEVSSSLSLNAILAPESGQIRAR